jgi:hypothetical protein
MSKKNRYERKAVKAQFLKLIKGEYDGKGKKGLTGILTLKDAVLGIVGGRLIAVATGKLSIPAGAALTALGHFSGNQNFTALGIGAMAANNQSKSDTVGGIDGLDGMKDRINAYKKSLLEDLYINRLFKHKSVNGFGEVQYFNYPDTTVGELAALDNIENQLVESGMQFQGTEDYVEGVEDYVDGIDDLSW